MSRGTLMDFWRPFWRAEDAPTSRHTRPRQGQELLVLHRSQRISVIIFDDKSIQGCIDSYMGWMPVDEFRESFLGYDPTFGDDRLCLCGHPYYRHFDTYDDMILIGCKYCHYYIEGVEYQKKTKIPEHVDVMNFTHEDWA